MTLRGNRSTNINVIHRMCELSLSLSRVDLHGRCLHSPPCLCVYMERGGGGVCARTISHEIATRGKVMTYCHRDVFIKRRERY